MADPAVAAGGGDGAERIDSHMRRVVLAVILGSILAVLDTTVVNVALESMSRDLHSKLGDVRWVVSIYLLSLAVVVPTTAWMSRRFGARRIFLVSIVLFTMGSVLCGVASSAGELIAFRVLQGLGGGVLTPVGQMILVKTSGPRRLPQVMSAFNIPLILAPVFGPTVGGLLVDSVSWRAIFYLNVPIGALAIVIGLRNLPVDVKEDAGQFDLLGLCLAATGLVGVTYGLAEVGSTAAAVSHVVIPLVAGVVFVGAFVLRSLRRAQPLLDLRLYANKAFAASSLLRFSLGAVLYGSLVLLPLYLQAARHQDAIRAGLLLGPRGIGAATASWLTVRLTYRFGAGVTAFIGGAISVGFTAPLILLGPHTSYVVIGLIMVSQGFGFGLTFVTAMTAGFRTLRPSEVNDASPQQNILQQVGGSIGVAVLTVVLQANLARAGTSPAAQARAYGRSFWYALAGTVVALVPAFALMVIERRRGAAQAPGPEGLDAVTNVGLAD